MMTKIIMMKVLDCPRMENSLVNQVILRIVKIFLPYLPKETRSSDERRDQREDNSHLPYSNGNQPTPQQHPFVRENSYLAENNMPDRVPPPAPAPAVWNSKPNREEAYVPSKTPSIKSFADDASNDTTIPTNKVNRDTLGDQSVYGHSVASDRSSYYQQKTPNSGPVNNPIQRQSPSTDGYSKPSTMKLNRDEDDNNTIAELIEKNLFPPESVSRSRSSSRANIMKKDDSGRFSIRSESIVNDRKFSTAPTPVMHNTNQPQVLGFDDTPKPGDDEFTLRSDTISLITADQESLTNKTADTNDSEDAEAKYNRVKFATLKKPQSNYTNNNSSLAGTKFVNSGGASTTKASLRPVTKSLQMGKQKLNNNINRNANSNSGNKGSESPRRLQEKEKLIGKNVNERLYYNAELMKKKKDFLQQKAEEKKLEQLEQEKFRLNEVSQRIVDNMTATTSSQYYSNGDEDSQVTGSQVKQDIGQKLYSEGIQTLENRKKKTQKAMKAKENRIEDWSCVKCGTFHKIPLTGLSNETPLMWDTSAENRYVCTNCSFNNKDKIESFRPTNIGLLFNEDVKETFENRSFGEKSTNIYDHLYNSGKQHEQILQLNRALWEDMQEKMYFKPSISEKSKVIIKNYKQQAMQERSYASGSMDSHQKLESGIVLENDDEEQTTGSSSTFQVQKSKIAGPVMKEYFRKSTFDRLTTTSTRSYIEDAITQQKLSNNLPKPPTFASSKASLKSSSMLSSVAENPKHQQEEFVNRLAYEYKDKAVRKQELTDQYYTIDEKTGQKLFQPKVPTIPEEIFPGSVKLHANPQSAQQKKEIWNDILRRDKELLEEKLKRQKQAIDKTLQDIQKNQVKALPNSNEILQSSTRKNLEDLFKLLLVSTHPTNEDLPNHKEDEPIINDTSSLSSSVAMQDKELKEKKLKGLNEKFSFKEEKEDKYSIFLRKDAASNNNLRQIVSEDGSNFSSTVFLQSSDNNTIISEQQINDVLTHHLKDWKEKSLDLLLIKPHLLVNEVSTLLLDMKYMLFEKWIAKQRLKQLNQKKSPLKSPNNDKVEEKEEDEEKDQPNDQEDANVMQTAPDQLLVTYEEFVKVATRCVKQRSGPGKGYIFAPKKKADVALQMKLQEYSEETFHPEIDKVSVAIIQKHLRQSNQTEPIPIEDILTADGQRVQKKIEQLRKAKEEKETKELTFKPQLYKPPSYIVPRYRGLDISDFEESEDGIASLQTNDVDPLAATLKRPMGGSSTVSSATNLTGSIYDIPNVLISSKAGSFKIDGPVAAIRGGGGGSKPNANANATILSVQIAKNISNKENINAGRSTESGSNALKGGNPGLSVDPVLSPKSEGKLSPETLLTPPEVRHSRLLNHQSDFPVPPPIITSFSTAPPAAPSSNLTVVTTNILGPPPKQATVATNSAANSKSESASTFSSFDYEESEGQRRPKDDLSIFSLTESASSLPTPTALHGLGNRSPFRSRDGRTPKSRSGTNARTPRTPRTPGSHRSPSKSGHRFNLLGYSSSFDSLSPPMSVSSSNNGSQDSNHSAKQSIDFPSKFSAVSDVSSSQVYNSGVEFDDERRRALMPEASTKSQTRAVITPSEATKGKRLGDDVGTRKPSIVPHAESRDSMDSGSSLTGYTASNTSASNHREGYSRKLISGSAKTKTTGGYSGSYLKSAGMVKTLPLLPHEIEKQHRGGERVITKLTILV